jgi:hypothetical protein
MPYIFLAILTAIVAISPANLTGTWTGNIAQKQDDGTYGENFSAWLQLRQEGGNITGSVGPSSSNTHPIEGVYLTGDKLAFSTHFTDPETKATVTWAFDMQVKDKTMEGTVKANRGEHAWEMRMSVIRNE